MQGSVAQRSQMVAATQMSISQGMGKQNVVDPHNRILVGNKRE